MNKVSIAPILKKLELYKTAQFPLTQYNSVNAAIGRIQTETLNDKRFTQKKNNELKVLEVTRIA